MTAQAPKTRAKRTKAPAKTCANCGRKLKSGRWIYSRHTRKRFCLNGEGCNR